MDSSVSPTHGEQEMSVWNGHYECTCYHPLFVFNQFGDQRERVKRPSVTEKLVPLRTSLSSNGSTCQNC